MPYSESTKYSEQKKAPYSYKRTFQQGPSGTSILYKSGHSSERIHHAPLPRPCVPHRTSMLYTSLSEEADNHRMQKNTPVTHLDNSVLSHSSSSAAEKKPASHPDVWGPAFWFSLHNGAASYPRHASDICAESMKGFILGIPVMVPCETCSGHARAHIEENYAQLDTIVKSRETLFRFFVDFHNRVNRRYNKPIMSYREAESLYSSEFPVDQFTYTCQDTVEEM